MVNIKNCIALVTKRFADTRTYKWKITVDICSKYFKKTFLTKHMYLSQSLIRVVTDILFYKISNQLLQGIQQTYSFNLITF